MCIFKLTRAAPTSTAQILGWNCQEELLPATMKHWGQAQISLCAWPLMMQVSGGSCEWKHSTCSGDDIPNAGTELRRHQTTHGGAQQRKGRKNSLAAFWIFTEPSERTGLRVTHQGEWGEGNQILS